MPRLNIYRHTSIYIAIILIWSTLFQIIDSSIISYANAAIIEIIKAEDIRNKSSFALNNAKEIVSQQEYFGFTQSTPVHKAATLAVRKGLPNIIYDYTVTGGLLLANEGKTDSSTTVVMHGATTDIADDSGILQLTGSTTMTVSGTVSTIRGSVLVIEDSLLRVMQPAKVATGLTITRDLTVGNDDSKGKIKIFSNLRVASNVNIHNGVIENEGILSIDGKLSATASGSLHLLASSLTTLSADSLLKDANTINEANFAGKIFFDQLDASMILTDWKNPVISQKEYEQLLKTLETLTMGNTLSSANVALWGVTLVQADGTPVANMASGKEHMLAGDKITMTSASANQIKTSGVYVTPQIVLDESSDTLIVGSAYSSGGKLTTIGLPTETINLIQKADGSVGNLSVDRKGVYNIGSGRQASGRLGTLEVKGTVAVNQGMQVYMDTLTLDAGLVSVIGANDLFTLLHTKVFESEEGTLFIDPAMVSMDALANNRLASNVILGEGAILGIGSMRGTAHAGLWARQQQNFTQAYTGAALSGALGISQAFTLKTGTAGGRIIVDKDVNSDGSLANQNTNPQQNIYFGDSSLLVIDASSTHIQDAVTRGEGIIKVSGADSTVYISDKSHLRLHEAKGNSDYIIISGAQDTADGPAFSNSSNASGNAPVNGVMQGWTGAQVSTNTDMLSGNTHYAEDSLVTRFSVNNAAQIYRGLSEGMANIVNGMYSVGANNLNSSQNGIKFLTRVTDNTNTYITRGTEARAMEGAARLAAVAGVHTTALAAADIGTAASLSRASKSKYIANQQSRSIIQNPEGMWEAVEGIASGDAFNDADAATGGKALWIAPLYQNIGTQGYAMGGFRSGTTTSLQGLAFGADFIEDETERWGISYTIGSGASASRGDFAKSTNTFNFYGMNAYESYYFNNFDIIVDLGVSHSIHKVSQRLPVLMDVPGLRAKLYTTTVNAGLRGEYTFYTDMLNISPYLGLRYTLLLTSPFITNNESALFSTAPSLQNLWTFPLGVTASKIWYSDNNWLLKCYASAGLTLNKGDRNNAAQVSMPGIGNVSTLETPVIDAASYNAELGLQVKKSNLDFGLHYSLASSKHSTSHGFFGTLTYSF